MADDGRIKSVRDDLPAAFQPVYADSFRCRMQRIAAAACMICADTICLAVAMYAWRYMGMQVLQPCAECHVQRRISHRRQHGRRGANRFWQDRRVPASFV